jgi:hypothetical protein
VAHADISASGPAVTSPPSALAPPALSRAVRVRPVVPAAAAAEAQAQSPRQGPEAGGASRTFTFDMTPPMGVTLTVDEEPPRSVSTGDALVLDGGEHALVFSCPVCTPVHRAIGPGSKSETLLVTVPVKPGTLVVEGSVDDTYQVVEHPDLAVRVGANSIPLRSTFERITVKQMETGATATVRLEAGKAIQASFPR